MHGRTGAMEWQQYTVTQLESMGWVLVEDGNHGEYRPRQHEFGSGDTFFIRAADMSEGQVRFDGAERINDAALGGSTRGSARAATCCSRTREP